eukprot:Gb_28023 [translate_table: standard]
MEGGGDDWIAMDKLQHFVVCFFIVIITAYAIRRRLSPSKRLHKWATWVGCIFSLMAGAVKELGDEMGVWPSAGGSIKDGVADGGGVLVAVLLIHFWKFLAKPMQESRELRGPMAV